MELIEWAKEVWPRDDLWIWIGSTEGDAWPPKSHVMFRKQIDRLLTAPVQRSWYGTLTQHNRYPSHNPRRTDVEGGQVLWTEYDGYHEGAVLPKFPIEPSYTIQTSREGLQYGWLLDEWQTGEVIEKYVYRICKTWAKSDPIHNMNRVLRIPYGINEKAIHGEPCTVRLVDANYKRYSLQEFEAADLPQVSPTEWLPSSNIQVGLYRSHEEIDAEWGHLYNADLQSLLTDLRVPRYRSEAYAVGLMVRLGMTFDDIYWRWYGTVNCKWLHDAEYKNNPEGQMLSSLTWAYSKAARDFGAEVAFALSMRQTSSA